MIGSKAFVQELRIQLRAKLRLKRKSGAFEVEEPGAVYTESP